MQDDILTEAQLPAFRQWLKAFFKASWFKIIVLGFLAMVGVGIELLNPFPLKILADSVFGNIPAPGPLSSYTGTYQLLVFVAIFYVLLYAFQSLVSFLSSYLATRFHFLLDVSAKESLFRHILNLPSKASQRLNNGDYVYRLNSETSAIPSMVLGTSVTIFQSVLTIVGVLVILLFIDWQMTLLSLIAVPLLALSVRYFGGKIEQKSIEVEESSSDIYTHTTESIENTEIVQSFNRQESQVSRLLDLMKRRLRLELDSTILSGKFGFVNSFITVMAVIIIVLVGGRSVFSGHITFGDLLIFVTYVGYLYDPLQTLSGAIASIRDSLGSLKRVFQVVNSYAEVEDTAAGEQLPPLHGQIIFRNVSFSDGGRRILKDVNFQIEPGQKVAFIGPSGSGKSTILRLIPRFLIPDSGFIYIDGHELRNVNINSLREKIAIVTQEPKLFSITIGQNIAFAHPDEAFPLPEVLASAEAAFANEFIEKLPNKFDTDLKQAGDSLSGGQKQRIAIARAFFKNAPILILDEPTSAQDVSSESHVLDGINQLMQGKTVVMVTHKHSLLAEMDKVYVVENGQVADVANYGGVEAYTRYLEVHEVG